MEAYSQFSGRPNWNRVFKTIAKEKAGHEIGVFLCGPPPVALELSKACKSHSDVRKVSGSDSARTVFTFHKENF
jgi:hypothetical protein